MTEQDEVKAAGSGKTRKTVHWSTIPSWAESAPKSDGKEAKFKVDAELNGLVSLWQGDMCVLDIDAVVNPANPPLGGCRTPGHCLDSALHAVAGEEMFEACEKLGGCATGEAKLTPGFGLPARWVLHTVGPRIEPIARTKSGFIWSDPDPKALASCYTSCLDLLKSSQASGKQMRSVAFCCISTGVYRYPRGEAAHVALRAVREWLEAAPENRACVDRIVFDIWTDEEVAIYKHAMPLYFPPPTAASAAGADTAGAASASAAAEKTESKSS